MKSGPILRPPVGRPSREILQDGPAHGHPLGGNRISDVRRGRPSRAPTAGNPAARLSQSHFDYLVEAMLEVNGRKQHLRGMEIPEEPPFLRHFSARFRLFAVAVPAAAFCKHSGPFRTGLIGDAGEYRISPQKENSGLRVAIRIRNHRSCIFLRSDE
jgi:hypothetical protein